MQNKGISIFLFITTCLVLFRAHCRAQNSVAILHYRGNGDNQPSGINQFQLAREQGKYPDFHGKTVFCIDSAYPNDIYCDVSALIKDEGDVSQEIYAIELEFTRTEDSFTSCSIEFKPENFPLTFKRQSVKCSSPSDSSPLIPRVVDMKKLRIMTRKTDNPTHRCEDYLTNDGNTQVSLSNGLTSGYITIIRFGDSKTSCTFPILTPLWSE